MTSALTGSTDRPVIRGRQMILHRVLGGLFAATSVMWSALAAQAFARGLVLDNRGCFGVYLAQPLRWWVLVQDAALLGYSALLLRAAGRAVPIAE